MTTTHDNIHAITGRRTASVPHPHRGFQAVAAHLKSGSDADLRATADLLARELHRRGMLQIIADIAHEIALEVQPGEALAGIATAMDTHHDLGGVA